MRSRFRYLTMAFPPACALALLAGCGSTANGPVTAGSGSGTSGSGASSGAAGADASAAPTDSSVSSSGTAFPDVTTPSPTGSSGASDDGAPAPTGSTDSGTLLPSTDAALGQAGVDAGPGCPGVPIVPDTGGFVAPGSNSVGIHGSWFVYSDCVDLKGVNCAMVASPVANKFPNVGGKMCTSGKTSTAPGAWGAGIGLELNDLPPQQPYDTTASGVKGFCFTLSGPTIPSTSIRVAFPTLNNKDNAYFSTITTPGQHTVLLSSTAQGIWVTTKVAFEPTKVMLLQFQIPSSTTAVVPWDFCVEGLTAITQ